MALISLASAVVMLSGCLRTELAVNVDGDGSGRVDLEVYFDELTLNESDLTTDDLAKLAETATQSIDGAEVSGVEAAGAKGVRLSIPFDDYRQVTQSLTSGEVQGVSTRLFQTFDIAEGDEGHWTLNASLDPAGFRSILSQIPAGVAGSLTQIDPSTEFVFSATLPGTVLRSNADLVDGGTARWNLDADAGPQTFTMESEPSSLSTLQKILIGVGALLVVGFILVFMTAAGSKRHHRRRGRKIKVQTNTPQDWAPTGPSGPVLMPGEWSSPPPYSSHGWGEATPVGAPAEPPVADAGAVPVGGMPVAGAVGAAPVAVAPAIGAPVAAAPEGVAPVADAPVAGVSVAGAALAASPVAAAPVGEPAAPIATGPFSVDPTGPPVPPTAEPPTAPANPAPVAVPVVSPVAPAPVAPLAAPAATSGTATWQNTSHLDAGRPGPPVLPEGFVPTPTNAFPVTHSYSQPTQPVTPAPYSNDLYSPAPYAAEPEPAAPTTPTAPAAQPTVPVVPLGGPGRAGPPPLPAGFVPDAPIAFPDTHMGGPPPSSVAVPAEPAPSPEPTAPVPSEPPPFDGPFPAWTDPSASNDPDAPPPA